jgi:general secretion pathway protein N
MMVFDPPRSKVLGLSGTAASALLGALLGGLMALITLAPALWMSQAVRLLSREQVLLLAPKGSIWQGSAQLALSPGLKSQSALGLPTRLRWQLRPLWLSSRATEGSFGSLFLSDPFTLALELESACCLEPGFLISLKPQGLGMLITPPPAAVQLPAQWLDGLGSPWNTVQPQGRLTLLSHDFQALLHNGPPQITGKLELKIDQLSSRLSTVKPLGSYRVLFNSQTTPQIELSSQTDSRLLLSGRGQWLNGRLRFEGLAETAPSDEETLSNLLNVLGQRNGRQAQLRMD